MINSDNGQLEKFNITISDGLIKKISKDSLSHSNSIDLKGSLIIPPLWIATQNLMEYLGMSGWQIKEGFTANFIILTNNEDKIVALKNIESAIIYGKQISF